MKPKLIALNLLLLAALGTVAWQARLRWQEAQVERGNSLGVKVKPVAPPPLSPDPKPDAPPATKYAEVATSDLFSKDRNPTVIIEAPKVEPPKPMPPLPVVYGVLGLPSGVKALMAEKSGGESKPVHAGDTVGEFKVIALDTQNVTFEWNGKPVERKIEDLIDRSNRTAPAAGAPAPQTTAGSAPVFTPAPSTKPPAAHSSIIGGEMGTRAERACLPDDTSPAGTVVDGYRKREVQTAFGTNCRWIPAQ